MLNVSSIPLGAARITAKHRYKGWFGREKFLLELVDCFGSRYSYQAWSDEFFAHNVGDLVEVPGMKDLQREVKV